MIFILRLDRCLIPFHFFNNFKYVFDFVPCEDGYRDKREGEPPKWG